MPGIIINRPSGVLVAALPLELDDEEFDAQEFSELPVEPVEPEPPPDADEVCPDDVDPGEPEPEPVEPPLRLCCCCRFSSLMSELRLSLDDSSISPKRIVEPVTSLSFGA